MLAASGNRTHLVLSRWTTAAATLLPSLEPSVNMRWPTNPRVGESNRSRGLLRPELGPLS